MSYYSFKKIVEYFNNLNRGSYRIFIYALPKPEFIFFHHEDDDDELDNYRFTIITVIIIKPNGKKKLYEPNYLYEFDIKYIKIKPSKIKEDIKLDQPFKIVGNNDLKHGPDCNFTYYNYAVFNIADSDKSLYEREHLNYVHILLNNHSKDDEIIKNVDVDFEDLLKQTRSRLKRK